MRRSSVRFRQAAPRQVPAVWAPDQPEPRYSGASARLAGDVCDTAVRCYPFEVPTTKPRHAVTETPEVAEALAAAARRWPEDRGRPGRLLRRLIREGHRGIEPGAPP
jgi:hypothetical protein